jgi:hypothetical protein
MVLAVFSTSVVITYGQSEHLERFLTPLMALTVFLVTLPVAALALCTDRMPDLVVSEKTVG